ncbi:MAG: hypothetical protein NTZ33_15460 [Bacteroidetes bacterium]|nr:hypothetical protein [Bacteroidota bacterium]
MKKILTLLMIVISFVAYGQDEITIDGQPCNLHGSSRQGTKEYDQNPFKNRYNFPKAGDFETGLSLENFIDGTAVKGKFNQAKAVEVTGYVYDVKVGGIETCNCKTSDPLFRDTHIELTLNDQDTGPEKRFIVEVTPRIRKKLADQGVDWTTEALKGKMKGHMVKIQGWLFYDFSHETENFADDPKDNIGRTNWRATSWEIHPITNLEILDEKEAMASASAFNEENESPTPVTINSNTNNSTTNKKINTMESTPMNTLIIILLGAILGMVGQGLRVVVGIKKIGDEAIRTGQEQKELIKTQQLVLSLFIASAVGAIAGVLAAVGSADLAFTKSTIFAFIAAGYAGTDFIEGFIRKNPTVTKGNGK